MPGLKVKEKRETMSLFRCEGNAFDLLIHLQDVTEKRLSTLDWWSSCINTDEHPRSTVLLQNKHNLQIEFPLLTHEHETRWPEILRPTSLSLSLFLLLGCMMTTLLILCLVYARSMRDIQNSGRNEKTSKISGRRRLSSQGCQADRLTRDYLLDTLSLAWLEWQAPINPVMFLH